jgi:cyclopropane fatty-acyl-phospholipid synthase-like methyltransferase
MDNATEINRAYYGRLTAGRESYWKLMPAPRMRIERVVAAIRAAKPAVRHLCDFGCGNGDLLAALAVHLPEAKLYGIDLSTKQIRENAAARPSIEWAVDDLTAPQHRFPFDQRCDVAVSSEVIEHVTEPLRYLKNIHASMEPDGLLVLTTQSGPVHATEKFVGHMRHWQAAEMAELLDSAGFRRVSVANCGFPFHDLSKWAANLNPDETIRRFGEREWGAPQRATAAVLRFLFRFNSMRRGHQLVAQAYR